MQGLDLSEVGYVQRVTVGSTDGTQTKGQTEAAMEFLNRCLREVPKGRIIGLEKTGAVVQCGDHELVLQALTYHIGFARKPLWLDQQ
jgi:hypothetical protein